MTALGEMVTIIKGNKADEVFSKPKTEMYPYLQIEDLRPGGKPKYAQVEKAVVANVNDVLIAWDGANAGTIGFGLTGYAGSTLAILRPNKDTIYGPYLGYFLRSKFEEIQDNCTGATIPHVNRNFLERMIVPLPSHSEQRRIAMILAKADRLRQLRRTARELGESFLQSVFVEMFGEPETNLKRWEIGHINDLCETILDCPHETPIHTLIETEYASVRSSDIQNGYLDWSTTKYVEYEEYAKRIERGTPMGDDVIYCREGARFGNAARIPENSNKKICLGQRIMLFRADPQKATPEFLWAVLELDSIYKQAERMVGGSASPHVNVQDIKKIKTIMPPLANQDLFAHVVRRYDRLRIQQRETERQAEMLFQGLLRRAFEGKV